MSRPDVFRNALMTSSVAPVVDAQLSLPGSARALANISFSERVPSDGDTPIATRVELTRATGARSRGS